MKKRTMQVLAAIIALVACNNVFSGQVPSRIILKNASAFDIVYKRNAQVIFKHGTNQEDINEKNVIKSGESSIISTYNKYPMTLFIKRYGYGSSLSPWSKVPDPKDLAKEQLNMNEIQRYYLYTEDKGKMPIITVKTGYTGGWSFTIGYMN